MPKRENNNRKKYKFIDEDEFCKLFGGTPMKNQGETNNRSTKPRYHTGEMATDIKNEKSSKPTSLDSFFFNEPYLDGDNDPRIGFIDVVCKLKLLDKGEIYGLIVNWEDYIDMDLFDELMDKIKAENLNRSWPLSYLIHPTRHGMYITNNENWFIKETYKVFRATENRYQVSEITLDDLSNFLIPEKIWESYEKFEKSRENLGGEYKYQVTVSYKSGNSVALCNLCSKKFAVTYCKFLEESIPDEPFSFSVVNSSDDSDIVGKTIRKEYSMDDIFDKSLDVDRYIAEVNRDNDRYYSNGFVYKILRNKC